MKKLHSWIFFSCVFVHGHIILHKISWITMCTYLVFSYHTMGWNFPNLAWISYFIMFGEIFLFLHFVFVIFHLLALGSIISKTSPFTTLNFFEHVTKTNPLCDELHVYNYMIIFLMIIKINYFAFNNWKKSILYQL